MRQERQLKKDMFKSFYREQYVFWRWAAWGITEWWDMTGARNSPPGMEMWGECRTKKYQRILCDIWTYLGVLKNWGTWWLELRLPTHMQFGKSWFLRAGEREHLWETPVIVLIVLWVKGRHVMSWVFLKSAKPVSWCGEGALRALVGGWTTKLQAFAPPSDSSPLNQCVIPTSLRSLLPRNWY